MDAKLQKALHQKAGNFRGGLVRFAAALRIAQLAVAKFEADALQGATHGVFRHMFSLEFVSNSHPLLPSFKGDSSRLLTEGAPRTHHTDCNESIVGKWLLEILDFRRDLAVGEALRVQENDFPLSCQVQRTLPKGKGLLHHDYLSIIENRKSKNVLPEQSEARRSTSYQPCP